jgi:hypothetical protein
MTRGPENPMKCRFLFVIAITSVGCTAEPEEYLSRGRHSNTGAADDEIADGPKATKEQPLPEAGAVRPPRVETPDAGVVDASPPPPLITAFGNAGAYAPITPPTQSARHDGYKSNAGLDCMSCHDGETPGVPRFLIAGTVYTTKGSNTGARNVQVRVVGPDGIEVALVGSDDAGNFWLKAGAITEIPRGSVVGVRNGLSTKLMGAKLGGGAQSCNRANCHVGQSGIWVN